MSILSDAAERIVTPLSLNKYIVVWTLQESKPDQALPQDEFDLLTTLENERSRAFLRVPDRRWQDGLWNPWIKREFQ